MREGNVLQKPLARKLPPKLLESSVSIQTASSLDDSFKPSKPLPSS
jgi:hypothetical protein